MMRRKLARIKKKLILAVLKTMDNLLGSDLHIRKKMKYWGYDDANYHFSQDQTAFIHISKTGGTSLAKILSDDPQNRFVNLNIHKPVSAHCPPEKFRYLTVLRNPVDRVWSLYQMTLHDPDGHHYRKFAERGLEPFLKKYWACRNMYCRYFSGKVFTEPGQNEMTESLENLALFKDVLLFERLENDIHSLTRKYDIPVDSVPHKRKSNNQKPSAEQRDLISRYNQLDIELYEKWYEKN